MYIQKPKKLSLTAQMTIGCVFSLIFGCLLHFIYEWSGENIIVAIFSPVNESPWEHLKTVYYPIVVFFAVQLAYLKSKNASVPNLLLATSLSVAFSMLAVTVLFYTYSGILGFYVDWINILIFFISIIAAYVFNYHIIKIYRQQISLSNLWGFVILAALFCLIALFTFYPPHIAWFLDPMGSYYGIK